MILLKKVCKGYCPVTKTQREIIVVYVPVYDVTTGGDHEENKGFLRPEIRGTKRKRQSVREFGP